MFENVVTTIGAVLGAVASYYAIKATKRLKTPNGKEVGQMVAEVHEQIPAVQDTATEIHEIKEQVVPLITEVHDTVTAPTPPEDTHAQ